MSSTNSFVREQLAQIKMLQNEIQIKENETDILKERIMEMEEIIRNFQRQNEIFEQKMKYYEKDFEIKLTAAKERTQLSDEKNSRLSLNVSQLQEHLLLYQREFDRISKESANCEYERDIYRNDVQALKKAILEREEELDNTKKKLKQFKMQNAEILKENEGLAQHLSALETNSENLKNKLDETIMERSMLERRLHSQEELLEKIEAGEAQLQRESLEHAETKRALDDFKRKYEQLFYDYNLLVINKKSNENDQYREFIEKLDEIAREKDIAIKESESKNADVAKLLELNRKMDLEQKERDICIIEDLKNMIILIETGNTNMFGNFLNFKSNIDNILILREKITQLIKENIENKKETKSLAKKQRVLREQIHSLSSKQEEISTVHYQMEEQDGKRLNVMQKEFEKEMEAMEQLLQSKTDEFERVFIEKEKEILNYKSLMNEYIDIIKQKELEKSEILNFLGARREQVEERRNPLKASDLITPLNNNNSSELIKLERKLSLSLKLITMVINLLGAFMKQARVYGDGCEILPFYISYFYELNKEVFFISKYMSIEAELRNNSLKQLRQATSKNLRKYVYMVLFSIFLIGLPLKRETRASKQNILEIQDLRKLRQFDANIANQLERANILLEDTELEEIDIYLDRLCLKENENSIEFAPLLEIIMTQSEINSYDKKSPLIPNENQIADRSKSILETFVKKFKEKEKQMNKFYNDTKELSQIIEEKQQFYYEINAKLEQTERENEKLLLELRRLQLEQKQVRELRTENLKMKEYIVENEKEKQEMLAELQLKEAEIETLKNS